MIEKRLSDNELIVRFVHNNDYEAIEALINRYKNKVYTYIFLNVKRQELAEDIFQDTFVKVIKSLKSQKYEEDGRFISWVIRIAHNLIIDHYRRLAKLETVYNDDCKVSYFNSVQFSETTFEEITIKEQIRQDIKKLINELPDDQKEVILLRHYGDLSFKEIAEVTGVSINTALGRMRYALINLRKLIKENDIILNY
jgi:RNA polymerase sigma-70 factor (ECF subfamily)